MAEVGHCLPHFQKYKELFGSNQQIKAVLCLFYRDILDFHVTILNFLENQVGILDPRLLLCDFDASREWKVFFESMWPRSAHKIAVIQDNMVRHKAMMNSEVTLENIIQAHEGAREVLNSKTGRILKL